MAYYDLRRGAWEQGAKALKEARHGPYTPNPEPPGDDWKTVGGDPSGFARAGLCELWRMDMDDQTVFGRCSDLHPAFNTSGLWWRKA